MALSVIAAPPSILLTTLQRVKDELGIADTSSDVVLGDMLARASSAIARECGRPFFGVGTFQEQLKGSGSQILGLTCVPILSVTQVLQDTAVIPPWAYGTNEGYVIEDAEAGALWRADGWGQSVNLLSWGWEAYGSRYILPGGTQTLRYTITYTAGYLLPVEQSDALAAPVRGLDSLYDPTAGGNVLDTAVPPTVPNVPPLINRPDKAADPPPLPGDLEQACLVTVKSWWFSRQRDMAIGSIKSGSQAVTYIPTENDGALPAVALGLIRDYRRVN
jgi:hypothetical protein